jgi:regulator of extracellular matrix RemA (YlzA/DUF370 family)
MSKMINIGYGNLVNPSRVVAVINSDSAPAKRLIQKARETDGVIDATQGRKTKSVLVMDSCHIVLSALQTDTLNSRFEEKEQGGE